MPIALKGGPLDGVISQGLSHLPLHMIATNHPGRPVYKRQCCVTCSRGHRAVPYVFVGYQSEQADYQGRPVRMH